MSSVKHRSCLSAEPHDDNIKESLLHFLGCVNISERYRLLNDDSHSVWQFETQHHIHKNGKTEAEANKLTKQKREKWRNACLSELRRIKFLRKKLEDDKDEKDLVINVDQSRKEWKNSTEYQRGIKLVKEWKKLRGDAETPETKDEDMLENEPHSVKDVYKPERDVNVPIIQFNGGDAQDFKVLEDIDGKKVWGSFPDQKTTVEHLLDESIKEKNILYREKTDNTIKYFHLPSNNMTWAEEAVSRYFNQRRPEFHKLRRKIGTVEKTEAAMILKESHWRGQLHGGQHSVKSRYMRPFCEALSSSVTEVDHVPKDIVLFMPYLHWETSRNRERFAQKIEQIVDRHHKATLENEWDEKKQRIEARKSLHDASKALPTNQTKKAWYRHTWDGMTDCLTGSSQNSDQQAIQPTPERPWDLRSTAKVGRIDSIGAAVQRKGYPKSPVKVDDTGRVLVVYDVEDGENKNSPKIRKGSRLGQYLIDAARLFEAITNYRDKCLLEAFLMEEAPVHPRRTLDQAFYWTLEQTRSRDKDQVVYRATTAKGADFHKYKFDDQLWPKHSELIKDETCRDCSDKIKKVSRVVMVDQLWMWILDANTIITCFPKRYGANKHDSSGIHKSIRTRIGDKRHQQVKSVFDLALIIFEECSNTFFDRTKTSDKQPQVLDAFSEAIGNIMHKQTLAFERLWRWTKKARTIYKSRARAAASKLHVPLLDITPEGELEKEIKDILEELGIMIYVNNTHLEVLNQFIRHVKHILDPHTELAGKDAKVAASRQRIGFARRASEANVPPFPVMEEEANAEKLQKANTEKRQKANVEEQRKANAEKQRKENYDWFNINADETLTRVRDRIDQLQELQRIANDAATSVKDLLELKQQQAGVVQAWQSVRQSDEANSQGRAIMVFTIVTIVFLPLSFMSSLFGMNTKEFGGDENVMNLREQFVYIGGISAPVIFLTLVFSLSNWIRSALACLFRFSFLWVCARIGLYQRYLDINLPSHNLHEKAMNKTEELLDRQMKVYSDRRWAKYEKKKKSDTSDQQVSSDTAPGGSQSSGSMHSRNQKTAAPYSGRLSATASNHSARQFTPVGDDVEAQRSTATNGST